MLVRFVHHLGGFSLADGRWPAYSALIGRPHRHTKSYGPFSSLNINVCVCVLRYEIYMGGGEGGGGIKWAREWREGGKGGRRMEGGVGDFVWIYNLRS